jgi:hypothetical protein
MHESMGLVALGFDYGAHRIHRIGVAMWRIFNHANDRVN